MRQILPPPFDSLARGQARKADLRGGLLGPSAFAAGRLRRTGGLVLPVTVDRSGLHHKYYPSESGDIAERIALDGDEIGLHA